MSEQSPPATREQIVKHTTAQEEKRHQPASRGWRRLLPSPQAADEGSSVDSVEEYKNHTRIEKWSLGIRNDKETEEVPGRCIVSTLQTALLTSI